MLALHAKRAVSSANRGGPVGLFVVECVQRRKCPRTNTHTHTHIIDGLDIFPSLFQSFFVAGFCCCIATKIVNHRSIVCGAMLLAVSQFCNNFFLPRHRKKKRAMVPPAERK